MGYHCIYGSTLHTDVQSLWGKYITSILFSTIHLSLIEIQLFDYDLRTNHNWLNSPKKPVEFWKRIRQLQRQLLRLLLNVYTCLMYLEPKKTFASRIL